MPLLANRLQQQQRNEQTISTIRHNHHVHFLTAGTCFDQQKFRVNELDPNAILIQETWHCSFNANKSFELLGYELLRKG